MPERPLAVLFTAVTQSFDDRRVKLIDKRQFILTNVNNGWQ
ncbi:hypothetical protein GGD46_003054 [Rhizobium lusitanum]|uniref:Uncharacterized protein n=1 Tax=Rhizobium lusitanum TaxID=293958 RepID=A0A7X0IRE2_9HYPH|nr:hypothetical protein [Rhizobium lusitanum]